MSLYRIIACSAIALLFFCKSAFAIPVYTIDVVQNGTTVVCEDCNPLGLGYVNGEVITYATPDSNPGELRAYSSDGSYIEMAPGQVLASFIDSDGQYAAVNFLDGQVSKRLDYLNPGVQFTASDPTFGIAAEVTGVNINGDFAGTFGGAPAAYLSSGTNAIFVPGPQSNTGVSIDINNGGNIIVGFSDETSTLNRATVWEVDSSLSVTNSFFLGSGEGNAYFVGDTMFDSNYTVLFEDNGQDYFYLGSSAETGTFGANYSILTAVQSAFILQEISSGICYAAVPGGTMELLGSNCVDAIEIAGEIVALFVGSSITTGFAVDTQVASAETPEPSTLALLVLFSLPALFYRRKSKLV